MTKIEQWQRMYKLSSNRKHIQTWYVWVEGNIVWTEAGRIDGAKTVTDRKSRAKNTGKKNATTAEQQAIVDAGLKWKAKRKTYALSVKDASKTEVRKIPMLINSKVWQDRVAEAKALVKSMGLSLIQALLRRHVPSYPCDIQPKLDGMACLALWIDGRVRLVSRNGEYYEVPKHIIAILEQLMPEKMELNGELYLHNVPRQTIFSLCRKWRESTDEKPLTYESKELQFHVYDMPQNEKGETALWETRRDWLYQWFKDYVFYMNNKVVLTNLTTVWSDAEIVQYCKEMLQLNYEGAVVRSWDAPYEYGKRSRHLAKVKYRVDDEFKIVGFTHGSGKFEDCVIWICEAKPGLTFQVVPKGTIESKRAMLLEAQDHVGGWLTVEYEQFSNTGKPIQPVGLSVRPEKDM